MTACALATRDDGTGGLSAWPPPWLVALLPRERRLPWPRSPIGPLDGRGRVRAVPGSPEQLLDEEAELCARAKAGDRVALGSLLQRHGPRLFRAVLLPRLGNPALAEEALGITYVKVVERFAQFTWQSCGLYPWLRVVALRVALDLLRSRRRERLFAPADVERELDLAEREDRSAELLERHDLEQARRRVEAALGRLHERYALVIRLRVLEERSREEAARELGITVPTLDVVLHRALTALRRVLATEGNDET